MNKKIILTSVFFIISLIIFSPLFVSANPLIEGDGDDSHAVNGPACVNKDLRKCDAWCSAAGSWCDATTWTNSCPSGGHWYNNNESHIAVECCVNSDCPTGSTCNTSTHQCTCNASVPCSASIVRSGTTYYCRNMNGAGYAWVVNQNSNCTGNSDFCKTYECGTNTASPERGICAFNNSGTFAWVNIGSSSCSSAYTMDVNRTGADYELTVDCKNDNVTNCDTGDVTISVNKVSGNAWLASAANVAKQIRIDRTGPSGSSGYLMSGSSYWPLVGSTYDYWWVGGGLPYIIINNNTCKTGEDAAPGNYIDTYSIGSRFNKTNIFCIDCDPWDGNSCISSVVPTLKICKDSCDSNIRFNSLEVSMGLSQTLDAVACFNTVNNAGCTSSSGNVTQYSDWDPSPIPTVACGAQLNTSNPAVTKVSVPAGCTNNSIRLQAVYAGQTAFGEAKVLGSSVCGNGIVESGEACDLGVGNGVCPSICSSSCTTNSCAGVPVCGNSIVETGEDCDNGTGNGVCPRACSLSCTNNSCAGSPVCGNGIIESGETCDDGAGNGVCPNVCSSSCSNNSCSASGSDSPWREVSP